MTSVWADVRVVIATLCVTLSIVSFGLCHPARAQSSLEEAKALTKQVVELYRAGKTEQAIPLALLLFNVGVELGQLGFIGVVLLIYAILGNFAKKVPQWANQAPAYLIGSIAAFWTIERTLGFWG